MGHIVDNVVDAGSLCFLFAPKQLHAALLSWNTTSAANHCYFSKTDSTIAGKN